MVSTFRQIDGGGDLPLAIQKELGIGAKVKAAPPLLTLVLPGGDSISVQEDGQIAIYRPVGFDYRLLCCECSGEVVNEIPRVANFVIAFKLGSMVNRIYRHNDHYFSFADDKFIHFKNYDITGASEYDDDDHPKLCGLFHTSDINLDDYYERSEVRDDESPIPRHGQPDQTEDDPKEGN